jgi:hypothetical protein
MGENVFEVTGGGRLTVTLPARAPELSSETFGGVNTVYSKTVTVRRPAYSIGYDAEWQKRFRRTFGPRSAITLIGDPPFSLSPSLLLTGMEAVREYLSFDSRGGNAANPVPLPVKIHLAGADSLKNLLQAIADAGKYVDLDLSQCSMNGDEFDPGGSGTGKNLVVSLVLPDAAQRIKTNLYADGSFASAFDYCTSLKAVSGREVKIIGTGVFLGCPALTMADFPSAIDIENQAFQDCRALTQVNLPAVTGFSIGVFLRCTSLTTLNLPKAAFIGQFCFWDCTSLTTLNLPAATFINAAAFLNTGTKSLTITLPRAAPSSQGGGNTPSGTSGDTYAKAVIVRRPANSTGYDAAWQAAFKQSFSSNASINLIFQDL